jgi:hypothetical protein
MRGVTTSLETPPSRKSAFVHSPTSALKAMRVMGRACRSHTSPPSTANSMSCGQP